MDDCPTRNRAPYHVLDVGDNKMSYYHSVLDKFMISEVSWLNICDISTVVISHGHDNRLDIAYMLNKIHRQRICYYQIAVNKRF